MDNWTTTSSSSSPFKGIRRDPRRAQWTAAMDARGGERRAEERRGGREGRTDDEEEGQREGCESEKHTAITATAGVS
jgi:hypothetical protein